MKTGRKKRRKEARIWYPQQTFTAESDIVKAYRNKFNVDKICAMRELVMLGLLPPEKQQAYQEELAAWDRELAMKREEKRRLKEAAKAESFSYLDEDQDEYFYYIAGYTSGGAPYGITWEEARRNGYLDEDEMEEARRKGYLDEMEGPEETDFPDDELPF